MILLPTPISQACLDILVIDPMTTEIKVSNRLFGQWSFRNLNLAVSRMDEFNSSEAVELVVSGWISCNINNGYGSNCIQILRIHSRTQTRYYLWRN